MMEGVKVTPMMQQYLQIKERYRDAILFFRLGDFYEMFFDDAHTAAKILDIALTSRNKSEDGAVPLCGVPYHAAEPYIQKLLDAGHKVAVCEQVEDPATAKGVVKREVVRVITPGTVTAAEALDARGNNFLAATHHSRAGWGLAITDITTGEFRFTQLGGEAEFFDELSRVLPSELIVAGGDTRTKERIFRQLPLLHLTAVPDDYFSASVAAAMPSNGAVPVPSIDDGRRAASAIVKYLELNAADALKVLRPPEAYRVANFLLIDEATRTNLELVASYDGGRKGSLLGVIDRTSTAIGARRIKQWLLYPLMDVAAIRQRHGATQELIESFSLREELKLHFESVQDLERLAGRVVTGSASPKDLVAIEATIAGAALVYDAMARVAGDLLRGLRDDLQPRPEIRELIGRAIVDDPPFLLKDGGYIRTGFAAELDELRGLRADAKDWIARFEAAERRRTGIGTLKVRYNRVFGYYIEVTQSHLKSVPESYIRKQTLANAERYITPELKEYEAKVLNAESLMEKIELRLLSEVREQVASHYPVLKNMSGAIAVLDCLLALAEVAESQHFVMPHMNDGVSLTIREGRHPVVETSVGRGAFVPNDCVLDPESTQLMLLTGPNMAGKSTYMRQVALSVILAQVGSFVPASEAQMGIVDQIFTRIGAADSLARGESTFMVEMKEAANILHHASRRSLILLDEVGRGTSTFDGISIAWAMAEALHDSAERPRTLFATHYHELTELPQTKERIKNFNFAVKEWGGEIIFLRNLVAGGASHSFGIHVARLAGMPAGVIVRCLPCFVLLSRHPV